MRGRKYRYLNKTLFKKNIILLDKTVLNNLKPLVYDRQVFKILKII